MAIVDPDEFFKWEKRYCPKCGNQIFTIFTNVMCGNCNWEGLKNELLNDNGLRKLKLDKLYRKLKLNENR